MVYVIENNGVYGLTKGQFSASADVGSRAKKGEVNQPAADRSGAAGDHARGLIRGAQLLGRQAAAGAAAAGGDASSAVSRLIDVLSPCVTFNDHEGSTRSYAYTREHYEEAVHADFVPPAQQIAVDYAPGETQAVTMHDGSRILLRKVDARYDPTDRAAALETIQRAPEDGMNT